MSEYDLAVLQRAIDRYAKYGTAGGGDERKSFLMYTGSGMGVTTQEGSLYVFSSCFERLELYYSVEEMQSIVVQYFYLLTRHVHIQENEK